MQQAIKYLRQGFSVIPVIPKDKKSLVDWAIYQKKLPTEQDIKDWWKKWPDANIGVITGQISGVAVIDIDSEEGKKEIESFVPDSLIVPIVNSPRGGQHWWFRCLDSNLITKAGIDGFTKVDLRANGGMIIAPPSVGANGKRYEWNEGIDIGQMEIPRIPKSLYDVLPKKISSKEIMVPSPTGLMFTEGRRDEDMFHIANALVKSRIPQEEIYETLVKLALACHPPFPLKEAEQKVLSALRRASEQPRNVKQEVSQWCIAQDGTFRIESCFNELNLKNTEQKGEGRAAVMELSRRGIIERDKGIGVYRLLDKTIEYIQLSDQTPQPLNFKWPFGIEQFADLYEGNIAVVAGTSNAGKGHPVGTKILSENGWKNIEDLKENDLIFSQDGTLTKINGIYQKGLQQCFTFSFNDRTSLTCDWDHLWTYSKPYNRERQLTGHKNKNQRYGEWVTQETYKIIARTGLGIIKSNFLRFLIPSNEPLQIHAKKQLPIDPYILGVLLGDGCLCKGTIEVTNVDSEIINYLKNYYQLNQSNSDKITYTLLAFPKEKLRELDLLNKHSYEKHIPYAYIWTSIENRKLLLAGLLDTDGTVSKNGQTTTYTTTSAQLAEDVLFLVRSLGEKAVLTSRFTKYIYKGEKKTGRKSYTLHLNIKRFNPFKIHRKAQRFIVNKRTNLKKIIKIENAGVKKTYCISTEHPSGLYIAQDFIVTHNTAMLLNFAVKNKDNFHVRYQSSEMDSHELSIRLKGFGTGLASFREKVEWIKRSQDWWDIILPDAVNIIDFMEIHEDFYKVGGWIKKIFDKLRKGIAIIALQKKDATTDMGRGGAITKEKARLYLSIDYGTLTIVKAKNWHEYSVDPTGAKIDFVMERGVVLKNEGTWYWKQ